MSVCSNCRNVKELKSLTDAYECKLGLPVIHGNLMRMITCPEALPKVGFQIGGYYSYMWFEDIRGSGERDPDACLEWQICSDGEFPTESPKIEFHICDFEQLERFVEFWRYFLEYKNWIPPRTKEDALEKTEPEKSIRNLIITKENKC